MQPSCCIIKSVRRHSRVAECSKNNNSVLYSFARNTVLIFTYISPEAEYMDEIQTKAWRVFLLAIHSHLYTFALRFLFLQNSRNLSQFLEFSCCTIIEKEKGGKSDKTIPPSIWFEKSIQKPQAWEPSRLCTETSTKLYFHEFGFCSGILLITPWETYFSK